MSGDGEPGQAEPASPTGEDPEPCDDCPKSPANNTCDADACSHNPDAPVSNTCMDGSAPSEDCDDDVQYIGGPGSGANDGREPALEESSGSAKAVPAAAGGLAIGGALVGAVVLALRRR